MASKDLMLCYDANWWISEKYYDHVIDDNLIDSIIDMDICKLKLGQILKNLD